MGPRWFVIGAIAGASGVVLGAFGAHSLKARVGPDLLEVWETAARYQILHALALLATAWASERWPGGASTAAGWLFLLGIVVFSGSLYALVLSGVRAWGAVTPVGGLCLIAGWLALALAAWRGR
ncbi:MAG TPA: DUF423 domain-containing protein [Candidatus Polarisedimenticolaceae bacterium]|nr:DUF423 domain-containing protein [Candidatus Polarisedimenticolaceae bacterium]